MGHREDELIRAHPYFYETFSPYVVRDRKLLRKLKTTLPKAMYHGSWKDLTRSIAQEYKNKGGFQ